MATEFLLQSKFPRIDIANRTQNKKKGVDTGYMIVYGYHNAETTAINSF